MSQRKIVYFLLIIALLLPLSYLSQPATTESEGGKLARLRKEYQLSQTSLGDIDPASETLKLATLGMRGVATALLWNQANYDQKVENWTGLSATLEQLTKFQPNIVSFWHYQAWNLSYNVSVQFDDYHDRYYWVIRGIDFLKDGINYNKTEPSLLWDMGWFVSQKIGRPDERVQFRRLFKADDDFHGSRPLAQRDNWLVGREWFLQAEDVLQKYRASIQGVTRTGEKRTGVSPLLFFSDAPKCLINYGDAIENEGTFGEVAKTAWNKADAGWTAYANRDIPTMYNVTIRLADLDKYEQEAKQSRADLEKLVSPEATAALVEKKRAALTPKECEALERPSEGRSTEEQSLAMQAEEKTKIGVGDLAEQVRGAERAKALALAETINQAEQMARIIGDNRETVNFEYWRLRCKFERTDNDLAARRTMYQAENDRLAAHLQDAANNYEQAFKQWRAVIDEFRALLDQTTMVEDLMEPIEHYRSFLHQVEREFPKDFVLQNVIDRDRANKPPAPSATDDADSSNATKNDGAAPK